MQTEGRLVAGAAGSIEVLIDRPDGAARGVALIAHPHPLFGGTADNKVVQTLARVFVTLGYAALRPNFRGVGQSSGVFDAGVGECADLLAVVDQLRGEWPGELVLAGFSFGAFVQTHVAKALTEQAQVIQRMVLVGLAVTNFSPAPVPDDTLLIHGENDDTVPLAAVLDWARPLDLAITVVPGADHFFHRRLVTIKRLVQSAWLGNDSPHKTT